MVASLLSRYFSAFPSFPASFLSLLLYLLRSHKGPEILTVLTKRRRETLHRCSGKTTYFRFTDIRVKSIKYIMAARGRKAPCGACKLLRRKCVEGCVFAPYFATEEFGAPHFAAIHKIFGAGNFSKLLHNIPSEEERFDAVASVAYEAQARLQDPVYGCVSHIFALQKQVAQLQGELAFAYFKLASSPDDTLLSPYHVNCRQDEAQVSFVNNAYIDLNSLNEPQNSHRRTFEINISSSDDKVSCFPKYQRHQHYDPLVSAQPTNVFQDNRSSMEERLDDIGDLQALVCSLLRHNRS